MVRNFRNIEVHVTIINQLLFQLTIVNYAFLQ